MTGSDCQPEVLAAIFGNRPLPPPPTFAYRPRVAWMQGAEPRSVECSELLSDHEILLFGESIAETLHVNGAFTVEAVSGNFYTVPAVLITEVCYQRVEVAPAHRPETTEQHHCCENPTACDGGDPPGAPLRHVCNTAHVTADDYDACEQRSVELAEQEARHPGLTRLLDAVVTQLPPDDPDRCAETLAAMDAAGPITRPEAPYAERKCPCWPGQCTCTEAIAVQGIPYVKGPLHAPHVIDPDQR